MITPRNPIFRPRKVVLELYTNTKSIPPTGVPASRIELTEVNSIEFLSTSPTVVAPGVVAAVIQPWYFYPITLNITGRSFIGAFGRGAWGVTGTDIMADQDAGKLIALRQIVNQKFFHSFSTVRKMIYKLSYEDPEDTENLSASQTLIGFVSELGLNENDPDPFVRAYRIRFTGEDIRLLALLRGTNNAKTDGEQAEKSKSDKVATNSRKSSEEKLANNDVVSEDDSATRSAGDKEGTSSATEIVSDDGNYKTIEKVALKNGEQVRTKVTEIDANGDGTTNQVSSTQASAASGEPNQGVVTQSKTIFIGGPTISTGSLGHTEFQSSGE